MQAIFIDGELTHAIGFRPEQLGEKSLWQKPAYLARRTTHAVTRFDTSWRPGKVVSFTPAPPSSDQHRSRGSADEEYMSGSLASTALGVEVPMSTKRWQGYLNAMTGLLPQNHTMDVAPLARLGNMAHDKTMQSQKMTGHRINGTVDYEPSYRDLDFGRQVLNYSERYGGQAEQWIPYVERLINNQVNIAKKGLDVNQVRASLKSGYKDKTTIFHQLLTLMQECHNSHELPLHELNSNQRKALIASSTYWSGLIEPSLAECTRRRITEYRLSVAPQAREEHLNQLDKDLCRLSKSLSFSGQDITTLPHIKSQQLAQFQAASDFALPDVPASITGDLRGLVIKTQKSLVQLADFNCADLKNSITHASVNVNDLLKDELNEIYGRQRLLQAAQEHGLNAMTASGTVALITVAMMIEPISVGTATAAGAGLMRLGDTWNRYHKKGSTNEAKKHMIEQLQQNTLPGALMPGYINYSLHWLHPEQILDAEKSMRMCNTPESVHFIAQQLEPAMDKAYTALKKTCDTLLQHQVHLRLADASLERSLTKLTNAQCEYAAAITNAVLKAHNQTAASGLSQQNQLKVQKTLELCIAQLNEGLTIPEALNTSEKRLAGFEAERLALIALNTGSGYPRHKPSRLLSFKPKSERFKVDQPFRTNSRLFKKMAKRLNFSMQGLEGASSAQATRLWVSQTVKKHQRQADETRSLPSLATHQLSQIPLPHLALKRPDFVRQRMVLSQTNPILELTITGRS